MEKIYSMKTKKLLQSLVFLFIFLGALMVSAQISSNVYFFQEKADGTTHFNELKISDNYLINTVYEMNPSKFIKTVGGFYTLENNSIKVDLEFNSNYEKDSITELVFPYSFQSDKLILHTQPSLEYLVPENLEQDLDGYWLFGTRGPDTGQERRGDSKPRKTLKVLQDNTFQWIAYNTETMKFYGTGGGSYSSEDGEYVEKIKFFSRDNSRVGAALKFTYELKEGDWHHQGNNSKGEPMYEIWERRSQ